MSNWKLKYILNNTDVHTLEGIENKEDCNEYPKQLYLNIHNINYSHYVTNLQVSNLNNAGYSMENFLSTEVIPDCINGNWTINDFIIFGNGANYINIDTNNISYFSNFFSGQTMMTEAPILNLDYASDLSFMFAECTNLRNIPIINMNNTTYIDDMFYNCFNLTNQSLINIAYSLPNARQVSKWKSEEGPR